MACITDNDCLLASAFEDPSRFALVTNTISVAMTSKTPNSNPFNEKELGRVIKRQIADSPAAFCVRPSWAETNRGSSPLFIE